LKILFSTPTIDNIACGDILESASPRAQTHKEHIMHLPNPFSFIKRYLADKPDLLTDYVNFGLMVVKAAIVPLGALLKHLLVVQNIDPNTEPGRKTKEDFQKALNAIFDNCGDKHFAGGFDFSSRSYNKIVEELRRKNIENYRYNRIVEAESVPVVSPLPVEPTLEVSTTEEPGVLSFMADKYKVMIKDSLEILDDLAKEPDTLADALKKLGKIAGFQLSEENRKFIEELEPNNKTTLETSTTTASSPIDDLNAFLYGDKIIAMSSKEAKEIMDSLPPLKETKKLADQYVADVKNNFQSPATTTTDALRKLAKNLRAGAAELREAETKKPSKIKRTKTGNVKAVKFPKKRGNKKLKSTQEIVQVRDSKGRFKGNFKRTPRQ
jgi:hypothetical protein